MERAIERQVSAGRFMGSVLVAQDGKILIDRGYGSADLAAERPDEPQTKFRLGSLTKPLTAAAILLLEERGKLKVEDPVNKYLPDAPAAWDRITIFHLLTHTSGIPSFTSFPDYLRTESIPPLRSSSSPAFATSRSTSRRARPGATATLATCSWAT